MQGFTNFLFAPGNRPDRIAKALETKADLVCIDLEDSVPATEKDAARDAALDSLGIVSKTRKAIRTNGLRTQSGLKDLLALAESRTVPELIFLPMVESPAEVEIAHAILGGKGCGLVPLIETVKGLRRGDAIAGSDGVTAMMFGGGDFSSQIGTKLEWEPLLAARSQFIMCGATAQLLLIDVPYIDLNNEAGLAEECQKAKALGFHAKAAIHPKQIETIAANMQPSAEEIAEAKAAIDAFEAGGGKAIAFNGRMLEAPVMSRYRQLLAAAK
ncbi:HpcH/HpaI aldolase/citrate lyase family protein [Alterisphingorhabdus coralli]|uniref:CoA ester lyase n=1 Tax=Alterisphingorhabdus coralli TaxID=3071408 RepID=A0AA97I1K0_9SPHN|nr:CoA ester lyase [Parasphingorhabdus sp. SCSIO 66989]WOE75375.1 CoA ester lyase [Parasphingorhabdus sp. SCSIO 66989]